MSTMIRTNRATITIEGHNGYIDERKLEQEINLVLNDEDGLEQTQKELQWAMEECEELRDAAEEVFLYKDLAEDLQIELDKANKTINEKENQ